MLAIKNFPPLAMLRPRRLLVKDAQLGLFGGDPVEVPLTPKAKTRKRLERRQLSLFEDVEALKPKVTKQPEPTSTVAPVKGRRARKGGEFVAGKRYAGGQWIPKSAFEAAAAGKEFRGGDSAKPAAQKLQLIQDTPEPVSTTVEEKDRQAAIAAYGEMADSIGPSATKPIVLESPAPSTASAPAPAAEGKLKPKITSLRGLSKDEFGEFQRMASEAIPFARIVQEKQQYAAGAVSIKPPADQGYHWTDDQRMQVIEFADSVGLMSRGSTWDQARDLKALGFQGFSFLFLPGKAGKVSYDQWRAANPEMRGEKFSKEEKQSRAKQAEQWMKTEAGEKMSAFNLAQRFHLPEATAKRILKKLAAEGAVTADSTGGYTNDPYYRRVPGAEPAAEAAIATPEPTPEPTSGATELPLAQFKGKGMTPSLSVSAFSGDDPLWYSQQPLSDLGMDAKAVMMGQKPSLAAQKRFLAVDAAIADGYEPEYYKAGKYSGVRVLVRDGNALTQAGLEQRYGQPISRDDYKTESEVDLRGAKEGDRKTIGDRTYELRNSRWHRVDNEVAEEPTSKPVAAEPAELAEPITVLTVDKNREITSKKLNSRAEAEAAGYSEILKVPPAVIDFFNSRISRILARNTSVLTARRTDQMFGGGGRYVWEATGGKDSEDVQEGADEIEAKRKFASQHNVDFDTLLNELGYEPPIKLTQEEKDWGNDRNTNWGGKTQEDLATPEPAPAAEPQQPELPDAEYQRIIDKAERQREILGREATAIAPPKDQLGGRAEKAVAKFLEAAGLSGEVFSNPDFAQTFKNPPYQDLAVERLGDRVALSHYYDDPSGDRVMDGDMGFTIQPNGQLHLEYTATHLYGREHLGLDKKFAETWAKNLMSQGFHEAASVAKPGDIANKSRPGDLAFGDDEKQFEKLKPALAAKYRDNLSFQLDRDGSEEDRLTLRVFEYSRSENNTRLRHEIQVRDRKFGGGWGFDGALEEVQRQLDEAGYNKDFSGGDKSEPITSKSLPEEAEPPKVELATMVNPSPADIQEQMEARRVEPSVMPDADYVFQNGQKRRIKLNQEVRELLEQGKEEYTPEEMAVLAQYSGKGGITEDEGSLSEYYTRNDVAAFVTSLIDQNGGTGGAWLEPSCGSGVFLHQLKGRDDVLPVGIEMDATSSQVAATLNPHAEVALATRFERFLLDNPDTQFDAIVGNVPFGTRTVSGDLEASRYKLKTWKDNGDLFVAESLERLKPGGVMALVVPHGIVSGKRHQKLRSHLAKHGRMLGAYRLPSDAFNHSGTSVVTDVLVMQRHPDAVLNAIKDGSADPSSYGDPSFEGGAYFDDHPHHVLGEVEMVQRGPRLAMTVKGETATAIASPPPFDPPAVDYDGMTLPPANEGPSVGDEKFINGRLYRLEGNPPRWHLVQDAEAEAQASAAEDTADPDAFGVDSMAAAEAALADPGQRVHLNPDHLDAYAELATGAERAAIQDAIAALKTATNDAGRVKLGHAMLLAHHLKQLQDGEPDEQALEQALNMLQAYREEHGNPALDRALAQLALAHPALLRLQGAFHDDDEGTISDYFANPDAVRASARRTHSEAGEAMREAFRTSGGEPVIIEEILAASAGSDPEDLMAALSSDPTVGYSNGYYQPIEKLMVGDGYALMDSMLAEIEGESEGSPLHRKLTEQVGYIRSKLEPRSLEDMTTPFWAVGSWISAEALNDFCESRDMNLRVAWDDQRKLWRNVSGAWTSQTEEDMLAQMNRERINHGSKTKEAKEAIAALEVDFAGFLAGSDHRLDVEQAYNLAFNSDLPPMDNGEPLDIPLVQQWDEDPATGRRKKQLHDYQNATIRQMIDQGRGMISLGVGLGKTATAIAMALQLKAMGRAQKPTFVVPKSVLANWVREIGFWAPDANVMIVGMTQNFWADGSPAWEVPGHKFRLKGGNPQLDQDGNYLLTNEAGEQVSLSEAQVQKKGSLSFKEDSAAVKEKKLRQLSQNSYDIVLMSEPVFQGIGLHPDTETDYLEDVSGKGRNINPEAKKTHKMLEQLETAKRKLAERSGDKTQNIIFEELGIDCLIHDEAHHLKNLFGTQRTGDVAFMSQAESNRSLDFYYKSRHIREKNNNQNVYLLTATPTTNNPLEAYNMLQHVCPDEFEKRGINNVDDFLSMFGQIESITVPGVDLEMTSKSGLVGFKNLKDLRKLFGKYCRMQSAEDVVLPIPKELTQDHYVDMSPAQAEVYADLKARAKELMKAEGGKGEGEDHIFSVISDMDKAAIDLDYYNASRSAFSSPAEVDPEGLRSPKIEAATANVMASRAANNGKQIVFCDAVQMHERLKAQLVAAGYPEDEIAIVNADSAKKSSDRQKISQAYNDGRITLVIGNTATMGEGMNFQIGTTDIHHLTTPWTPAAIEQRNGRGVRQGNSISEVGCHYYHANKSFDAYRKGVVERKRGWIDKLWKGGEDTMNNQNTGGLDMNEIAVMMSDDPDAARQQMANNEEAQMAAHRVKQTKGAMRQFGQLQTMRLAYSKIKPERIAEQRAIQLRDRIQRTVDALGRNEFFPHKSLLDGSTPAYVGGDGTVLTPGHHIKEADGSVWRVTAVDTSASKIRAQQVSGPNRDPLSYSSEGYGEWDFASVNGRQGTRRRVEPTDFSAEAHEARVVESISDYKTINKLTPATINANREKLAQQITAAKAGYVPFRAADGSLGITSYGETIPEGAGVLWPHDGDTVEALTKEMANPDSKIRAWSVQQALEGATGRSWNSGLNKELQPRIDEYKAQFAAMKESGPKPGDTRINSAGNEEVFRDGRWRRMKTDQVDTAAIAISLNLDVDTRANVRRRVDEVLRSDDVSEYEIRRMVGNAAHHLPEAERGRIADGFISGLREQGVDIKGQSYHRRNEGNDREALMEVLRDALPDATYRGINRTVRAMQNSMDETGAFDAGTVKSELVNRLLADPSTMGSFSPDAAEQAAQKVLDAIAPPNTSTPSTNTPVRAMLKEQLGDNEPLIDDVDKAIRETQKDGWRGNLFKERELKRGIYQALSSFAEEQQTDVVFEALKNMPEGGAASAPTSTTVETLPTLAVSNASQLKRGDKVALSNLAGLTDGSEGTVLSVDSAKNMANILLGYNASGEKLTRKLLTTDFNVGSVSRPAPTSTTVEAADPVAATVASAVGDLPAGVQATLTQKLNDAIATFGHIDHVDSNATKIRVATKRTLRRAGVYDVDAIADKLAAELATASTPERKAVEAAGVTSTQPTGTEAHPDPIGAIHDALVRIQEADYDRGALRNDEGWSAFTRDFGSSLAAQVQGGQQLSANQLKSALAMLTKKHRPQAGHQPTLEELEAAIALRGDDKADKARPNNPVQAELKQTVHAKRGVDLYVVTWDKVTNETYGKMKKKAGELGGYYSRYAQRGAIPGMQFESREAAEQMMEYVSTLEKTAGRLTLGGVTFTLAKAANGLPVLRQWKPWNVRLVNVAG